MSIVNLEQMPRDNKLFIYLIPTGYLTVLNIHQIIALATTFLQKTKTNYIDSGGIHTHINVHYTNTPPCFSLNEPMMVIKDFLGVL